MVEVFPSASCAQMPELGADIRSRIRGARKDVLDAVIAARTVREYEQSRGGCVGGGDGLGEIILPRQVDRGLAVHRWPEQA